MLLPSLKVLKHLQDCEAMATDHHSRPFAKHGPSTLVLVGKQLLDFFGHSIRLLIHISEEQALYAIPETPKNAKVFTTFCALTDTKQLNVDLEFLNERIICNGGCFLCELLDPFIVFASVEENVLLLLDLLTDQHVTIQTHKFASS